MQTPRLPDTQAGGELIVFAAWHHRRLVRVLQRRAGSIDDAEDVVQEAYVRLLSRAECAAVDHPSAYLYRAACNIATDRSRRERLRLFDRDIDVAHAGGTGDPWAPIEARDALMRLAALLAALSPRCRRVVEMRRFDELETHEIAARLGISVRMVQRHLARGLDLIQRRLDGGTIAPTTCC